MVQRVIVSENVTIVWILLQLSPSYDKFFVGHINSPHSPRPGGKREIK